MENIFKKQVNDSMGASSTYASTLYPSFTPSTTTTTNILPVSMPSSTARSTTLLNGEYCDSNFEFRDVNLKKNNTSIIRETEDTPVSNMEQPFSFRFKEPPSISSNSNTKPLDGLIQSEKDDLSFLLSITNKAELRMPSPETTLIKPKIDEKQMLLLNKNSNPSSIYSATCSETNKTNVAQVWPLSRCALILSTCHFTSSFMLIVFDAITNPTTHATIIVSAALAFFVAAIFALMIARRVDRIAQWLLLISAFVCDILCALIFIDSARNVNAIIYHVDLVTGCESLHNQMLTKCFNKFIIFHTIIVCISLIEFVIFAISIVICVRSLRHTNDIRHTNSLVSSLIFGAYNRISMSSEKLNRGSNIKTFLKL